MLLDFFGQIINSPVDGNGILTAAVSPPFLRIPNAGMDGTFLSYLFPLGIYAFLAHQLDRKGHRLNSSP